MATTNFQEAVGNCIMRQAPMGSLVTATVFPATRSDFFREVTIVFEYSGERKLVVGVIQRTEGAECESHS